MKQNITLSSSCGVLCESRCRTVLRQGKYIVRERGGGGEREGGAGGRGKEREGEDERKEGWREEDGEAGY